MRQWITLVEAYLSTVEVESEYGGKKFHVEVFKNPSRMEFMKALRNLDYKIARGNLYPDGTLLVCFEEEVEHYALDDAIGGSGDFTRLFLNATGVTFYGDDFYNPPRTTAQDGIVEIKAAKALQRIYGREFEVRED
jgi:hypothetical protein